jgi:hypothetical protein
MKMLRINLQPFNQKLSQDFEKWVARFSKIFSPKGDHLPHTPCPGYIYDNLISNNDKN